jgi:malate dehydrogenase (oxaloacetate-decarboxylating)(NADP+)
MEFLDAIDAIKPHVLIGATGVPGVFTEAVLQRMSHHNQRPVIFALSNPTSRAECTAEQAYRWSDGRAIFASGSPFALVTIDDKTFIPGQGNNAYVFPGIGLGALAAQASIINDEMFLVAARTLADQVSDEELASGSLYPPLKTIRWVSLAIATAVAKAAKIHGLSTVDLPDDLEVHIQKMMYEPGY